MESRGELEVPYTAIKRSHPVQVQDIDVVRAQLLQGRFDRKVQTFDVVASIMRLLRDFRPALIVCRVLHTQRAVSQCLISSSIALVRVVSEHRPWSR